MLCHRVCLQPELRAIGYHSCHNSVIVSYYALGWWETDSIQSEYTLKSANFTHGHRLNGRETGGRH